MKVVAFDFETHLISPDSLFPPAVCLSVATVGADGQIESFGVSTADSEFDRIVEELFKPGHLLVGQNVHYDIGVAERHMKGALTEDVWRKLHSAEITDTRIREMLINLGTHGHLTNLFLPDGTTERITYGLDDLVLHYLGVDLSAEKTESDAWRLRYKELDGVPWDEFPRDAQRYAQLDAVYTLQVYLAQEKRHEMIQRERDVDCLVLDRFQTAADFALAEISDVGSPINPDTVHEVEAMLLKEFHAPEKTNHLIEAGILRAAQPAQVYARQMKRAITLLVDNNLEGDPLEHRAFLEENGIKFKKPTTPSTDTKKLKAHVEALCKEHGFPVKRTAGGDVSTDKEVLVTLGPVDAVMGQYQDRQKLAKLVSTELPALYYHYEGEEEPRVADRVFFNYNILVETGRTSSFGNSKQSKKKATRPACNGQQRDPRIRPCFEPDEGFWYLSVDYSALELVSTAQTTFDILGYSKHREKINQGYDLHSYLGAQLALFLHDDFRELCHEQGVQGDPDAVYELFRACKTHESEKVQAFFKHWRKFAKPVGLGYPGGLGARTFLEFAKSTYDVDVAEIASHMEDDEFEITGTLLWHAKRMGITEENFKWTRYLKGLALAIKLKDIWLRTYPEMVDYFKYVNDKMKDPFNRELGQWDDGRAMDGLCYTTPMGMHRAACTFTKAANGRAMQSPSAEGAKIAIFNTVRECLDPSQRSVLLKHGCKTVNFVHDELILQVPANSKIATECAKRVQRVMEESMEMVMCDVKVTTEACLMERWDKGAEPVIEDGLLVPWKPKEEEENSD